MGFARSRRRFGQLKTGFQRSSPMLLGVMVAGCLSEPIGPALNQIDREPPPVTLEWVGNYTGTASGIFDQVAMENVAIEMVVTFDRPANPNCSGCVTVQMGEFFGRMNLLPQTPISAEWSYTVEERITTLTLQKFSSSAAPGSVFFGTVRIETEASDPALVETLTAFDFVVERQ